MADIDFVEGKLDAMELDKPMRGLVDDILSAESQDELDDLSEELLDLLFDLE